MDEEELVSSAYEVSLPVFEGPMDLLLHLVTKNRIDIHDIPIHEITDQYLEYLEEARAFDLELSSSFFSMAASLLLIKSRMLLPRRREEEDETDDPRQELARSLEEFKRMKEMRAYIEGLLEAESPYHLRGPSEISSPLYNGTISLARLSAAFAALFEEKEMAEERVLEAEEITFDEKRASLLSFLAQGGRPMTAFLRRQGSRMALAVALVAMLEMIRTGEVTIEERAEGFFISRAEGKADEAEPDPTLTMQRPPA